MNQEPGKAGQDTKRQILETATRLFHVNGYYATSLEEVAAELGVTRQAFYYYYKSKEDLLWDINSAAEAHLLRAADTILEKDLPPLERLASLLESHALVMAEHAAEIACFYQEERSLSQERQEAVQRTRRGYTQHFIDAYQDAMDLGLVGPVDPKLAAFLLLGACNWISKWYSPHGPYEPQDVAETVTRMNLYGVITDAGRDVMLLPARQEA